MKSSKPRKVRSNRPNVSGRKRRADFRSEKRSNDTLRAQRGTNGSYVSHMNVVASVATTGVGLSRVSMRKIAVIFDNLGPYHIARLERCRKTLRIIGDRDRRDQCAVRLASD